MRAVVALLAVGLAGCSLFVDGDDDDDGRAPVLRYYLDEATAGMLPETISSTGTADLDLTMTYTGDLRFVSDGTNSGLQWPMAGAGGSADAVLEGDALDALRVGNTYTIEVVVDITAGFSSGARIVTIDELDAGDLTLQVLAGNLPGLRVNDSSVAFWDQPLSGRQVLHLVVDTDQEPLEARYRLFAGGRLDTALVADPADSQPFGAKVLIDGADHFTIGNRTLGARSPEGIIYYAAIYNVALTGEEIEANAAALRFDDDTPEPR